MFNCMKYHPKLCRCPVSKKEQIQNIRLALNSNLWDMEEKKALKKRLKILTGE